MQRITTFLWFDRQAEEAAKFYCSVFKKSKILGITRQLEGSGAAKGDVLTVQFRLGDQEYVALNGGPHFKFTEAISLMINCKDQKEVDYYWRKLGAGGDPAAQVCGWLKDRFGLSWQIVPDVVPKLMGDHRSKKSQRAFAEMMRQKKPDIAALQRAYDG